MFSAEPFTGAPHPEPKAGLSAATVAVFGLRKQRNKLDSAFPAIARRCRSFVSLLPCLVQTVGRAPFVVFSNLIKLNSAMPAIDRLKAFIVAFTVLFSHLDSAVRNHLLDDLANLIDSGIGTHLSKNSFSIWLRTL